MKDKYITWIDIHPIIREMFFITDSKLSDIGYVSRGGNLLVSYKAIINVCKEIYEGDYSEEELENLYNWIKITL